jgi:hypothetical protein
MCRSPRKPQRNPRRLRLVGEAGVVEAQLLQGLPQVGELVAVDGIEPAEHHGLGVAIAGQRPGGGAGRLGHRLARPGLGHILDPGDEVAGLARAERCHRRVGWGAHPDLVGIVDRTRLHEPQAASGREVAVDYPDRGNDAPVGVVVGVEDQRLEGRLGVAGGRRHSLDDGIEQLGHALAGLGADT